MVWGSSAFNVPDETNNVIAINDMKYLALEEWKEPKGAQIYSDVSEIDGP